MGADNIRHDRGAEARRSHVARARRRHRTARPGRATQRLGNVLRHSSLRGSRDISSCYRRRRVDGFSDANEPLDEQMRRLARCGVTHISGTPSRWRRALMSPERALIAPQYVRLSGEIADQALLNALKEAFRPAGGVPMLCVDRSRRRVQRYRRP